MKDRVPLYPGRVKLTPVSGKENTYDMVRADEPTQEGTPLSKATFLKDVTAALFGLDATAVPDDALAVLSRFHKGLGNEYVWEKTKQTKNYTYKITNLTSTVLAYAEDEILYSDTLDMNDDGFVFDNTLTTTRSNWNVASTYDVLKGKYICSYTLKETYGNSKRVALYVPADATFTYSNRCINITSTSNQVVYRNFSVEIAVQSFGYVNSPDPNAYPPSEPDGYTYTLLGQLANLGVKIATGNYSGAGVGGPSSPNTLTFDFEPQILLIATKDGSSVWYFVASRNSEYSFLVSLYNGSTAKCSYSSIITWNGETVSWYCTADRSYQMNYEGLTYNYIAIG